MDIISISQPRELGVFALCYDVMCYNLTDFCLRRETIFKNALGVNGLRMGAKNFPLPIDNCSQYQPFQNTHKMITGRNMRIICAFMTALKALIQIRVGLNKGGMNKQFLSKGKTRQSSS